MEIYMEEESEEFAGAVTITSVGQITIPKEVRKKLKLKSGDKLLVYVRGKEILLRKP